MKIIISKTNQIIITATTIISIDNQILGMHHTAEDTINNYDIVIFFYLNYFNNINK